MLIFMASWVHFDNCFRQADALVVGRLFQFVSNLLFQIALVLNAIITRLHALILAVHFSRVGRLLSHSMFIVTLALHKVITEVKRKNIKSHGTQSVDR